MTDPADLVVTLFGKVHTPDCPEANKVMTWPWEGRNNLSGDRAHEECLPDGLPESEPYQFTEREASALREAIER